MLRPSPWGWPMKQFFRSRILLAVIAAFTATLFTSGNAAATIPTANGVIHGCIKKSSGVLRVIDPSKGDRCHKNEVAIEFNREGRSGAAGAPGNTGPAGTTGTGANGLKGATGATGNQGPKGDKGDTGAVGATGATGSQGPKGDKGDTGATGAAGATGSQGPKGDKGDTGAVGATGATGSQGPKGDKGDTGATGAAGATGSQGPKGDTGATGAAGAAGATGSQGPKGDPGATGPQGPAGISSVQQVPFSTPLTVPNTDTTVASLPLAAGNYLISVTGDAVAFTNATASLTCSFAPGTVAYRPNGIDLDGSIKGISATGVVTLGSSGTVTFSCNYSAAAGKNVFLRGALTAQQTG
jgi:Collagen triple helix repeat (20 copies)